jgi:hypothetical protein
MGFFDARSVKSQAIRDYAFPQTWLGKVAPMGQFAPRQPRTWTTNACSGRVVRVRSTSVFIGVQRMWAMPDGLSELYEELLGGSYDCVDRIVLNAYFGMGHSPGGFRVWWWR